MAQAKENVNKELFEEMPIPKALATMAVPTVIGQLIILIYNLADTFFIGRTNDPVMVAGVSLILPIFNICIPLSNMMGIGGGSLMARLLGIGKEERAKKVSTFSLLFAFSTALLFSLGVFLFMVPLLHALGASKDTFQYARQYATCVIVLGGIPTIMSMTMASLLRNVGCSKEAGFGVSMGGIINIALDPLFMFVLLPHGKEIIGAGLATMTSNVISCLYFIIMIRRLKGQTVLTFSPRLGLPEKTDIASVFSVGIPAAVATLLFDVTYIVIDKLASGYSDMALAAIGIVLKAERLPLNIGVGLAQGMMPIAAYNYSSGNYKRMRGVVNFSRIVGLIIGVASVVLYECLAGQIIRIFIKEAETVRIGIEFLRIRALATPLMFLSFHMVNMFQSLGLGKRAFFLAVARWAIFNIPLLYIMNHIFGMYGIVWTQSLADLLTVILSFAVYYHFEKTVLKSRSL